MHTVLKQRSKKKTKVALKNFADLSDTPETHQRISIVASAIATATTFCIDSFTLIVGHISPRV